MSYILSLLVAAGIGSAKASGQGTEPGFGEAQPTALPPVIVNFQGHLRQGTTIINGTYSMTFRLYNAASGGTLLQNIGTWNVNVASGVFNVELPITRDNILNYTDLWVEVEIPALGGIYTPRVKINAAAFAYNAYMADTAQNFMDNALQPQDLLMRAAGPNQWNDFDLDDNGRIDLALLDVPASGTDPGYIWNQFAVNQAGPGSFRIATRGRAGADPPGRFGELAYGGGGAGVDVGGVYGQHSNTTAYGYLGVQNASLGNVGVLGNGGNDGVFGQNNADYMNGAGVEGYSAFAASGIGGLFTGNALGIIYVPTSGAGVVGNGSGIGVVGYNTAPAGSGAGVRGFGTDAASGIGVIGVGNNLGGAMVPSYGCGVAGTGDTVGVFGYATLAGGMGVWGSSQGVNGNAAIEGQGTTDGTAIGIWGYAPMATYNYFAMETGVQGSSDYFGVIGIGQDRATTRAIGVWGLGANSALTNRVTMGAAGVCGVGGPYSDASPAHTGVYGRPDVAIGANTEVEGALGTYWWYAINSVNAWIGVIGYENDAGTNGSWDESWAGLFDGDVFVTNDVYVQNWVIAYNFVYHLKGGKGGDLIAASPKTVYNDAMLSGTVNLSGGEARVKLDQDFLAMIDPASMRVTATAIGAPVTVYVAEITSDGFVLKSVDGKSCRVDWMVMAYQAGMEAKIDQSKAGTLTAQATPRPKQAIQALNATKTTRTLLTTSTDDLKTIKATHQRAPADLEDLKEVK